jgi:Mn-dependent DtxR family transcriptional regulator
MNPHQGRTDRNLQALAERGFVRHVPPAQWALTEAGVAEAEGLLRKRDGRQES